MKKRSRIQMQQPEDNPESISEMIRSDYGQTIRQQWVDAFRLLRIPFSVFLMPVFWFALSQTQQLDLWRATGIFLILHVLVYPASNGYNSWFDRDEDSIGGLEKPPQVNPKLFTLVVLFDLLALFFSLVLGWVFLVGIALYLMVSKAYSWDRIRLKKYPLLSTLVVTFFQGAWVYWSVRAGLEPGNSLEWVWGGPQSLLGLVSSLFLLGAYPLTQVYQHQEDKQRGDRTLSLVLGVRGTFVFTALVFPFAVGALAWGLLLAGRPENLPVFVGATMPVVGYFGWWGLQVARTPEQANYRNAMRMNLLSSLCLSLGFVLMLLQNQTWPD